MPRGRTFRIRCAVRANPTGASAAGGGSASMGRMRLLLIRHGESANNRLQADTGAARTGARSGPDRAGPTGRPDGWRPRSRPGCCPVRGAAGLSDEASGVHGGGARRPPRLAGHRRHQLFEVNGVYLGEYRGHQTVGAPPGQPRLRAPPAQFPPRAAGRRGRDRLVPPSLRDPGGRLDAGRWQSSPTSDDVRIRATT